MAQKNAKDLKGIESEQVAAATGAFMEDSEFGDFDTSSGSFIPAHRKRNFIGSLGLAQAQEIEDERFKI
jgi:hypothetical protein